MGVVVNINYARVRFTDEPGKTVEVLAKAPDGSAQHRLNGEHDRQGLQGCPYWD